MTREKTVMALGFFDGIHLGHAKLIETAKKRALELDALPAVLTFDNHPDAFVKKIPVRLINSAEDRVYIINKYFGVSRVFFLHFNELTMKMPWRDFLDGIITEYGAVHFVVGHDFSFGYMGEGTAERLRAYCAEKGIGCDIIEQLTLDGVVVSSTYIRGLIEAGDIKGANRFLGHPHLMTDTVRSGFRLGRTIDAPTINMQFAEGVLVPKHGVYAAKALLPTGEVYAAVTNIGVRPTFGGDRVTVETNIMDFDRSIYGARVCIELYSFIRPERKFDSAAELSEQIHADTESAGAFFPEPE